MARRQLQRRENFQEVVVGVSGKLLGNGEIEACHPFDEGTELGDFGLDGKA